MTNMPQVSTSVLLKAFYKLGFVEKNRNNSHVKIVHMHDPSRYAAIPNHRGQCVAPGTLRNILKSTRIDVQELRELL
jgi:predicted RNA binding protein YcfA (HicA-like mRNA interferase family)